MRWDAKASRIGARPRVFPSLCDWLDEEVPIEWLVRFMATIISTPHLDWLLLTKRPELWWRRISDALAHVEGITGRQWPDRDPKTDCGFMLNEWLAGNAPQNVWLGVSVEDQTRAEGRIPLLLGIPARLRWLSVEPLIGPVDLRPYAFGGFVHSPNCENEHCALADGPEDCSGLVIPGVDWVVVGGESGSKARPCNVAWIRDIADQCKPSDVPVFVKQLGANPVVTKLSPGQEIPDDFRAFSDPKGGDQSEWPADLRVREFPK